MTDHQTELVDEQKYFDEAWDHRERTRENLKQAPGAAAGPRAGVTQVSRAVAAQLEAMPDPDEAVAFGRIDLEDDETTFYLGKHAIWSEDKELLVIEWQRPAVAGFYEATVADPHGVTRRRKFVTDRNQIESFEDTVFSDLIERVESLTVDEKRGVDDVLLRDLDAARDGEMHDIVQTIHESQYDLIRRPLEALLVVQGGPGTGKTAVALHRASWLLFNHREEMGPEDVLVIGPSKTFGRYIQNVLPGLGNVGVEQRDLTSLAPIAGNGRQEDLEVARLKGDARMAGLLKRALRQRIRFPERSSTLDVGSGSRSVSFTQTEVESQLEVQSRRGTYNAGRLGMREWLTGTANGRLRGTLAVDAAAVDAALERVWPQLTPAAFLQDLLGSRQRITSAAGDDFTAGDIERLYRASAPKLASESWADSDVALLDEAEFLINGRARAFAHVIVDEAQDLTPMQLCSVRRRSSTGSYTIVGDLAQSTGPWARATWDDIIDGLRRDHDPLLEELKYGYRVPRQVTDLADRLLPYVAPGMQPPTVIRSGPADPEVILADADMLPGAAIEAARGYAADGHFVGIICGDADHESVAKALRSAKVKFTDAAKGELGTTINLLTAEQSKGLEFDAVVVVEPAAIARVDHSGLRHLYIALTRTTKYLKIVHSKQFELLGLADGDPGDVDLSLIQEVTQPQPPASPAQDPTLEVNTSSEGARRRPRRAHGTIRERTIRATAEILAEDIRSTLDADSHAALIKALAEELGVPQEG